MSGGKGAHVDPPAGACRGMMEMADRTKPVHETLDYLLQRMAQIEALCAEAQKVRSAIEAARERLTELEASGEVPLSELKAILDTVEDAQLEWEGLAGRLAEIWAPRGLMH